MTCLGCGEQVESTTDGLCAGCYAEERKDTRADVWDEGFDAGREFARALNKEWPKMPQNPYRRTQ